MPSGFTTTVLLAVPRNSASGAYSFTMPSTSEAANALVQLSRTASASSLGPATADESNPSKATTDPRVMIFPDHPGIRVFLHRVRDPLDAEVQMTQAPAEGLGHGLTLSGKCVLCRGTGAQQSGALSFVGPVEFILNLPIGGCIKNCALDSVQATRRTVRSPDQRVFPCPYAGLRPEWPRWCSCCCRQSFSPVASGRTAPTRLGSNISNARTTTRTLIAKQILNRCSAAGSLTPSRRNSRSRRGTKDILRIAGTRG